MPAASTFSRRTFLTTAATIGAVTLWPAAALACKLPKSHRFKLCLNPGNIGIRATQSELLDMAIAHGYEAIVSMPDDLAAFSDAQLSAFRQKMDTHEITWGSTNLPVEFRQDEERFQRDLSALKIAARTLEQAGATRMNTWVLNGHQGLTYRQNFTQHTDRLSACAEILQAHGIRLGLEYVAPKTSMIKFRYPFIRTLAEMRELINSIGAPNAGLVLDSFHWYCAEDTTDDIRTLNKEDIVTVDLNDARADLSRDEQLDGTRELPLATGVIDMQGFLNALVDIGYNGPVRSEPFNQALKDMEDEEALKVNYIAMKKAFNLIE